MLKVGFGAEDITPPAGAGITGYYYERFATGAHDPLYAKALVFDDGKTQAAVLTFDVSLLPQSVFAPIAEALASRAVIPLEHTIVSAIQTHTGPVTTPEYTKRLARSAVAAVTKARDDASEAHLTTGTVTMSGLAFNRRYRMKDGSVVTNPGKCNPNVVEPAGPAPNELQFVRIERPGKGSLALTNVPLHPDTVGGDRFSADYPYFMEQRLRMSIPGISGIVYTNGACGNINHWDVHDPSPQRGFEEAERIGTTLGANVLAYFDRATPITEDVVRAGKERVRVPYAEVTETQVSWAREALAKPYPEGVDFTMDVVEATKIMHVSEMAGDAGELELGGVSIGDIALLGVPAELFTETASRIQDASPFRETVVICLAGAHMGYIPTEKAFPEGAYEVASCLFKPEAERLVFEGSLRLLNHLRRRT